VASELSKRILKIARDQQDELNDEEAVAVAARGEFFGISGQMRLADIEDSESEGEHDGDEFRGDDDAFEEVVHFPRNPRELLVLMTSRKWMKGI
jgi:essential nuclear protein 1